VTSYLGIDVGTSAVRVAHLRDDGSLLGVGSESYASLRTGTDVVEQDPTAWTDALTTALRALPDVDRDPPSSIGLCGQTPTLVLVDEHGRPMRNALTWQDTRATREARYLAERFGDPTEIVGTALSWSAANMPAKLLWLSRHEPDVTSHARVALQPKDYIGLALTGSTLSDPWSSKGLCDVTRGVALADVLDACGWSSHVCPPTAAPWETRGTVSADAGERFGLRAGTPVTVGASDAIAEMIAAGSFARASAFFFSGTSSIVGSTVADESVRVPGLFRVPTTCAPLPLLYGPTNSGGGAALQWAARLLGVDVEDLLTLAASAGRHWPTFVPYLSGERAPWWDLDVRALFLGVDERHGRAEMAKSVVVGVLLAARHVLSLVEGATRVPLGDVEVVSRGVQNPHWEAMALQSLGADLRFHHDPDMSARGAAMLAMSLGGASVTEASRRLGAPSRVAHPERADVETARHLLEDYRRASEQSLHWRHRDEVATPLR